MASDAKARCETARRKKRKLPHISVYCTGAGELRWRVRVQKRGRQTGGTSRQWWDESFSTESEAVAYRNKRLIAPEDLAKHVTVAEYLESAWLPHYRATFRPSSYRTRLSHVNAHLQDMFGDRLLGELSRGLIERTFDARRASGAITAKAAAACLTTLRAALNQAVDWEMLASNPCQGVRIVGERTTVARRIWTLEQYHRFMATQSGLWAVLWALLATTGMRIGEALALRWEDIVVGERTVIRVSRTVAHGPPGSSDYEDTPKSAAGRRTIVLGVQMAEVLHAWREEQSALTRSLAAKEPIYVFGHGHTRRAYPGVKGYWNRQMRRFPELPRITMHALRHMSATEQLAAGVPLKVVSARLGHAKLSLTSDLYSHVLESHQEEAASVADVFASSNPKSEKSTS